MSTQTDADLIRELDSEAFIAGQYTRAGRAMERAAARIEELTQQLSDMTSDYMRLLREKQARMVAEAEQTAPGAVNVPLTRGPSGELLEARNNNN